MTYIIENASTSLCGKENRSYLIEGSKVAYTSTHFAQYTFMRMNTDNFIVRPGHVMIDMSVIKISNFNNFKERMKFLQEIGCTTVISAFDISYESQFVSELKKAKHALINSTIDFVIGLKIPLRKLTPTLMRKCCQYDVPILFTEINEIADIYRVQWQRIREELYRYRVFIIPVWKVDLSTRNFNRLQTNWLNILAQNKIYTQKASPKELTPLSKQFLLTLGLYPNKGSLHTGSDADYLLYFKDKLINQIHFHTDKPEVVIVKGVVKKAGQKIYLEPGSGKEITIKVPSKFVPIEQAFQVDAQPIDYY